MGLSSWHYQPVCCMPSTFQWDCLSSLWCYRQVFYFLLDCEFQSMAPASFECSLVALPWNDYTWLIHLVPFLYMKRKVCHRFSKLHMVLTFKSWFLYKALKRAFYNTNFFRWLVFFFFLKWIKLIFFLRCGIKLYTTILSTFLYT